MTRHLHEVASYPDPLSQAIERARAALAALQQHDGSWQCDTNIGPIGIASLVLAETLFRELPASDARALHAYFARAQREDGSFAAYPHAETGSSAVTALAIAALLATGTSPGDDVVRRARDYVDAHGGLTAIGDGFRTRGDIAPLYLLAHGHLDASILPPLPAGLALAPLAKLLGRRMHAGNVMMLLVLVALAERAEGPRRRPGMLQLARRSLELRRVREYLCRWQNDDGSWNGSPLQTSLMLLGLHAAGMTKDDPAIKRALTWLDGMKRRRDGTLDATAMDNDVWSTALCALALHSSGSPADDPAIQRAQSYLLDAQLLTPMPSENQRRRGAPRTGGWPFQRGNHTMPDTDDTGVVIAALATLAGTRTTRNVFRAIDNGIAWLEGMQNPDGGFPTFAWGLPAKEPGPMFMRDTPLRLDDPATLASSVFQPIPELGDPSVEGVTGRVLWGLGAAGRTCDDPIVLRAIEFLRAQQCDNGAWWGRWKACYLAETATILLGLAAVGHDPRAAFVVRARDWILSRQNDDGGFGELPDAYRDPHRAGRGPSMPPVTAYVMLGCLAIDPSPSPALERAADYLIREQQQDGLWDNAGWLHTFIPPDLFYTYPIPAQALPLLALAKFRAAMERGS